jgi:hypothetical protein
MKINLKRCYQHLNPYCPALSQAACWRCEALKLFGKEETRGWIVDTLDSRLWLKVKKNRNLIYHNEKTARLLDSLSFCVIFNLGDHATCLLVHWSPLIVTTRLMGQLVWRVTTVRRRNLRVGAFQEIKTLTFVITWQKGLTLSVVTVLRAGIPYSGGTEFACNRILISSPPQVTLICHSILK